MWGTLTPMIYYKIKLTDAMDVVMGKNTYEEGTPEYEAFEAGVGSERARILKIVEKYHRTFCNGEITDHDCDKTMQIRYLHEFVTESRTLK